MEDITLSLGAIVIFAGVIAQAIAAREGIKRNRERHDKRDGLDLLVEQRLSKAERWQRDRDVEARVRSEMNDPTPVEAMRTKEWER